MVSRCSFRRSFTLARADALATLVATVMPATRVDASSAVFGVAVAAEQVTYESALGVSPADNLPAVAAVARRSHICVLHGPGSCRATTYDDGKKMLAVESRRVILSDS